MRKHIGKLILLGKGKKTNFKKTEKELGEIVEIQIRSILLELMVKICLMHGQHHIMLLNQEFMNPQAKNVQSLRFNSLKMK